MDKKAIQVTKVKYADSSTDYFVRLNSNTTDDLKGELL
jgi:hypothetical protein